MYVLRSVVFLALFSCCDAAPTALSTATLADHAIPPEFDFTAQYAQMFRTEFSGAALPDSILDIKLVDLICQTAEPDGLVLSRKTRAALGMHTLGYAWLSTEETLKQVVDEMRTLGKLYPHFGDVNDKSTFLSLYLMQARQRIQFFDTEFPAGTYVCVIDGNHRVLATIIRFYEEGWGEPTLRHMDPRTLIMNDWSNLFFKPEERLTDFAIDKVARERLAPPADFCRAAFERTKPYLEAKTGC